MMDVPLKAFNSGGRAEVSSRRLHRLMDEEDAFSVSVGATEREFC